MKKTKNDFKEEQKVFQIKYRGMKILDAPPRSEWMTIDECFDDIIDSVEKIYGG